MRRKFGAVVAIGLGGALFAGVPAFAAPPSPPVVRGVPGNAQVALAWAAPPTGGRAITDYVVQYKRATASGWTTFRDGVRVTPGAIVKPLVNRVAYDFRVAAKNPSGLGAYSRVIRLTPGCPSAPGRPTATVSGGDIRLTWAAGANGGFAVRDYRVQYSLNSGSTWVLYNDGVRATTGATVRGLPAGKSVIFRVAALTANCGGGYGAASTRVTTPRPVTQDYPAAYTGSMTLTLHTTQYGADMHTTITFAGVRYGRNVPKVGWYKLSAGSATITSNGTTSGGCSVNGSTTVGFNDWKIAFRSEDMTIFDSRKGGLAPPPPPGTGPVYYGAMTVADDAAAVFDAACPGGSSQQYGVGISYWIGNVSSPWVPGTGVHGFNHSPSLDRLAGSRTYAGDGFSAALTWDFRAGS